MTPANVKRGRITNFRTGNWIEFLLNPASISEKKSANFAEDDLPGGADSLLRWMSGKCNVITVTLQLDGEIGIRRRGQNLVNTAQGDSPGNVGYSVAAEIEWYEHFLYPVSPEQPGSKRAPDKVIFSFGRRYKKTLCTVCDFDLQVTEFSPELDPTKATISLTLKRVETVQRFAHQIFSFNGES